MILIKYVAQTGDLSIKETKLSLITDTVSELWHKPYIGFGSVFV